MAIRVRRFSALTAVLAVAAVLVPAGSSRANVLPTLYVAYTMNCTFAITDDSGKKVSQVAPGTYQIYVTTPMVFADVDLSGTFDMTACKGFVQFQLTGPGVNLSTTLQDGDEDKDLLKATFQASATYTATDLNQPSVARAVFTTAASGSPTAPTSSPSSSSPSGSSPSGSKPKGTPSTDIVGSAILPFRGTLAAAVSAAGKLTLTYKGQSVQKLTAGKYTVSVVDQSTKSGFTLKLANKLPVSVTGAAFVGKHAETLFITQGQWTFFTVGGPKHFFFVAA